MYLVFKKKNIHFNMFRLMDSSIKLNSYCLTLFLHHFTHFCVSGFSIHLIHTENISEHLTFYLISRRRANRRKDANNQ